MSTIDNTISNIDVSFLASGIYHLEINTEDKQTFYHRFSKI